MQIPTRPQPNLSLSDTTEILCESPGCNSNVFVHSYMIRKVSALLTGTGKPTIIPIEVFVCVKCHSVLNEFLPEGLKQTKLAVK